MLPIEKLREKLKNRLRELKLEPNREDKLVREISYLSELIIDSYLKNKNAINKSN